VEAIMAVDSQMQRLKIKNEKADKIGEDALLEEAIKLAAAEKKLLKALEKCNHGYNPPSSKDNDRCFMFVTTYIEVAFPSDGTLGVHEVLKATANIFPRVWDNEKNELELIKTFCLSRGVEAILEGNIEMAQCVAYVANHLEGWIHLLHGTKAVVECMKLAELIGADEHTLVSFF